MKFKEYLGLITDDNGFVPVPLFRWVVVKNPRKTAREEAIAAEVLRQANPRENISGHYPWGPEEQMVLQQLWVDSELRSSQWRDVPTHGVKKFYSVEDDLPVPNAIKEPGMVQADFRQRIKDALGE